MINLHVFRIQQIIENQIIYNYYISHTKYNLAIIPVDIPIVEQLPINTPDFI